MADEALRCSYVVLSVGRYLNPALAVQTLNPEPLPPHTMLGVFFAGDLLVGCAVFQLQPARQHGLRLFNALAFRR